MLEYEDMSLSEMHSICLSNRDEKGMLECERCKIYDFCFNNLDMSPANWVIKEKKWTSREHSQEPYKATSDNTK